MAKASQRAPVLGPAFIRLLARFNADDAAPLQAPALSERLSQWFDWNRAISLSRALDNPPPPPPEGAAFASADEAGAARVRATLMDAIHAEIDPASGTAQAAAEDSQADGYAPYRQHYLDVQRAMQAATGRLRGQLRDMLARQSPTKARLAEVDAVMEATLSPREHTLLSQVPALLGQHYQRLLAANTPAADDAATPATTPAGPWLVLFVQDLRIALLAELDVRFHPIEGLLAALRTR